MTGAVTKPVRLHCSLLGAMENKSQGPSQAAYSLVCVVLDVMSYHMRTANLTSHPDRWHDQF